MSERERKALEIAARTKIKKDGKKWLVPSQTGNGTEYVVDVNPDHPNCTCPDHAEKLVRCKHMLACEIVIQRERTTKTKSNGDVETTATETVKLRYKQVWSAYNNAQVHEKSRFLALLFDLCSGVDDPIQTMGRTRLPLRDMLFAAAFKVYSTASTRRFMTDLKDAHARRYISKLPCYNSVIHYLEMPELTSYLQALITQSSLPLKSVETDFAVDSSGFSTSCYASWFNHKYGKEQVERDWVKAHLMCGVTTNVVTAVEVSGAHGADPNYFAPLVNHTAHNFEVREVSADKAYSNYANMRVADNKGITPYIDFKSNASGKSRCAVWNKMYHF